MSAKCHELGGEAGGLSAHLSGGCVRFRGLAWVAIAVLLVLSARAEVRLNRLFTDHMVLQREMLAPVWGWADPGERVSVQFAGQSATAVAGPDGKWMTRLGPFAASSSGRDLVVTGKNTLTVTDVLVGDVWLGSGQSNMEFAMRDVENSKDEIAGADRPLIRLFTVPRSEKSQLADDVDSKWVVCRPDTVRDFSAVLYLFGREINAETKVPVGLIHSSVGGTRIELWTAPEGFATVPEFAGAVQGIEAAERQYREQILPKALPLLEDWIARTKTALANGTRVPVAPDWPDHPRLGNSGLYLGMIHPLVPFGLRGVAWYQGEWNGGENDIYVRRMQALIAGWRQVWNRPDLPFYYVQLARMPQKDDPPWLGDGLSPTREAQRKSLAIPHTGMAVIIDLPGDSGWHPRNKQDVARRLSLWALHNEYGRKDLVFSGPLYREMTVEEDRIRLRFDHVGSGLMAGSKNGLEPVKPAPDQPLKEFAVAGANRKWVLAEARIDGADVVVSSLEVPHPVAVRYAYCNDPEGANLYNKEGLPASPFRTDDW